MLTNLHPGFGISQDRDKQKVYRQIILSSSQLPRYFYEKRQLIFFFSYASSSTLHPRLRVSESVSRSFGLQPSSVAWSLRACCKY